MKILLKKVFICFDAFMDALYIIMFGDSDPAEVLYGNDESYGVDGSNDSFTSSVSFSDIHDLVNNPAYSYLPGNVSHSLYEESHSFIDSNHAFDNSINGIEL